VLGPRLDVEIHDADAVVDVDIQLLAPTISQLLQNAYAHTHPRGRVALRSSASESWVRVEIEDECGGLRPETAAILFDLQNTDVRGARGLGLALALRSIEEIGGTIRVRDLPGQGCVFAVELPRASRSS
jgi:signal transduction histidine kinase